MSHPFQQSCIAACYTCATACNHCAASCLMEDDVQTMAKCIANDIECAEMCAFAAAAMARGSVHAAEICALCAVICQGCADECGQHAMAHCQACAKACLDCVKACQAMSAPA